MKHLLFLLIITAPALWQCKSNRKTQTPPPPVMPPAPDWVTRRPINHAYYIGIGSANKQFAGNETQQAAKRNALQDLASEIQVNISSNSLLYTLESSNTGFREDFKQTTRLNTQMNLRDFEQVDIYETDKEIFVYYRLSKQKYQDNRNQEIKKATDNAANSIHAARTNKNQGDYRGALTQYLSALSGFEAYLSEPVSAEFEGKEVFFDNLVAGEIKSVFNDLTLVPLQQEIVLPVGSLGDGVEVGIKIKDKDGRNVSGIPIMLYNKDLILDRNSGTSDAQGIFMARIKQVRKSGLSELSFRIQPETMVPPEKKVTATLVANMTTEGCRISIRGESPRVYFVLDTRTNGISGNGLSLLSGLSESLTNNGFQPEINRKKAHLIIEINSDTREAGEYNGFFTTSMQGTLVIRKADTNQELFRKDLSEIKGVDLSYSKAGAKAYETLRSSFIIDYLPQFKHRYFAD